MATTRAGLEAEWGAYEKAETRTSTSKESLARLIRAHSTVDGFQQEDRFEASPRLCVV